MVDPSQLGGVRSMQGLPSRGPRPMLATAAPVAPRGRDWIHEIKLDGYRMLCLIQAGRVRLMTRSGLDWTDRFGAIAAEAAHLSLQQAVLDGEIVVLNARGLSDFNALQNALKGRSSAQPSYWVFDLLHLDQWDLTGVKLEDRKALLRQRLSTSTSSPGSLIRLCEDLHEDGPDVLSHACQLGAEGIVSKRLGSRYLPGQRSGDWLKIRCLKVQRFLIVGYTPPRHSRTGFGALLLAEPAEQGYIYRGLVGTGFDEQTLKLLEHRLDKLSPPRAPDFADQVRQVPRHVRQRATWAEPRLVAEVAYVEQTPAGVLRQPSFRGWLETHQVHQAKGFTSPIRSADIPRTGPITIMGVKLSNPNKVLYPGPGLTKRDLAAYYARIAPWALPGLRDRPLSLLRCPDGLGRASTQGGGQAPAASAAKRGPSRDCFFQKDHRTKLPEGLTTVEIQHDEELRRYAVVQSAQGLVALAQLGTLEIHPWSAKQDRPEHPDRMIFDLDPGPGVAWEQVVQTAHSLHELLELLGLTSFVRTTGGKGLHVVVPLVRRHSWSLVKNFSKAVAGLIVQAAPRMYTLNMNPSSREGRIYVDYLRNDRGATAIGSFSSRAQPDATVAMPLSWDELTPQVDPGRYTILTVPSLVAAGKKEPWAGLASVRQQITRTMRQRVGLP